MLGTVVAVGNMKISIAHEQSQQPTSPSQNQIDVCAYTCDVVRDVNVYGRRQNRIE